MKLYNLINRLLLTFSNQLFHLLYS